MLLCIRELNDRNTEKLVMWYLKKIGATSARVLSKNSSEKVEFEDADGVVTDLSATAVNESTWEHIKIALTPTILWSLIDGLIYGSNPNYFFARILLSSLFVLYMQMKPAMQSPFAHSILYFQFCLFFAIFHLYTHLSKNNSNTLQVQILFHILY